LASHPIIERPYDPSQKRRVHEPAVSHGLWPYAWFAGIVLVELSVCYALGLDTLSVGHSRALRLIQLGILTATSFGFLFYLSRRTRPEAGITLASPLPGQSLTWAGAVAFLALITAALIAVFSIESSVLLSGDESAYVYQADMFAHGRLWSEPTPIQPYVAQHYIFPANGKLISQYPPGWPAILAAAQVTGIPIVLVNPIIGALIVLALWRFAVSQYNKEVALTAAALMAASAFFLFNSASFYNGNVVALFGVLFATSACSFLGSAGIGAAVGLGVWFSALAITRHFDVVLFAAPVVVALLRHGTARHWTRLPLAALAAAPAIVLLFYYYWEVTGSPFVIPQTLRTHNDALLGVNWSAWRASEILAGRFVELAEWISPPFVFAFIWALLQKFRRGHIRFFDLYGPIFLAGYWLFWSDGSLRWGPRYIYPALPFMVLTVVEYACFRLRKEGDVGFARLLAVSAIVATIQVPFVTARANVLINQTQDIRYQVREAGIHHAVVVAVSGTGTIWSIDVGDLARNGLSLDGDVIYAHGPALESSQITPADIEQTVQALHEYFPTREIWLYRREKTAVHGALTRG